MIITKIFIINITIIVIILISTRCSRRPSNYVFSLVAPVSLLYHHPDHPFLLTGDFDDVEDYFDDNGDDKHHTTQFKLDVMILCHGSHFSKLVKNGSKCWNMFLFICICMTVQKFYKKWNQRKFNFRIDRHIIIEIRNDYSHVLLYFCIWQ